MRWRQQLLSRDPDTHKGDYGHCLIVGGSPGLSGAVCLAASACLRIGAGLVTVGIPRDLSQIFEVKLTEVMSLPLDSSHGIISCGCFSKVEDFISRRRINSLALGPGLSCNGSVKKLVERIISEIDIPVVLDADGINAVADDLRVFEKAKAKVVLTPHPGEFSRLIKKDTGEIRANRKKLAKDFALRYNLVLVLKGSGSLITDGERLFENKSGNPGMATAGSGDILTGMISGLVSQGLDLLEAARLGVYLHGLAGDLAAEDKTQGSLIASDIIDFLPKAIRQGTSG